MYQTNGKSLEDIAEVFGDEIALEDENLENIHRQFKMTNYNEGLLVDLMDREKVAGTNEA